MFQQKKGNSTNDDEQDLQWNLGRLPLKVFEMRNRFNKHRSPLLTSEKHKENTYNLYYALLTS